MPGTISQLVYAASLSLLLQVTVVHGGADAYTAIVQVLVDPCFSIEEVSGGVRGRWEDRRIKASLSGGSRQSNSSLLLLGS